MAVRTGSCVLLAAALVACQPVSANVAAGDILCAPKRESIVVLIDTALFWRVPPIQLAAGEIVVEAEPVGMRVLALRTPDTEFVTDTLERACTCVSPAVLHQFSAKRVISGDFDASAFAWLQTTGGCGSTSLNPTIPFLPSEAGPAFMVIRPAGRDLRKITPLSVMYARFENEDPPCLSNPGEPSAAPGC